MKKSLYLDVAILHFPEYAIMHTRVYSNALCGALAGAIQPVRGYCTMYILYASRRVLNGALKSFAACINTAHNLP